MEKPRNVFRVCSLLMAILFAYSASVQLNDPGTQKRNHLHFLLLFSLYRLCKFHSFCFLSADWYFWFPLYTLACAVNLINCKRISNSRRIRQMIKTALSLALFLLVKVVTEDVITEKVRVFSSDLTHRVVREKIGSGLVIASMILQLRASSSKSKEKKKCIDFGKKKKLHINLSKPVRFLDSIPVCPDRNIPNFQSSKL